MYWISFDFGVIFHQWCKGFDHRITSYNVCYTKLLREDIYPILGMEKLLGRIPQLPREIQENVRIFHTGFFDAVSWLTFN